MKRVTPEMLEFAAEWCESYEAAPLEDGAEEQLRAVAVMLRAMADKKRLDATVRAVAKNVGRRPSAAIKAAVLRSREKLAAGQ